jgi:hypothetical protein
MPHTYTDPRYRNKPHPGRKPLPVTKKRKLIAARIAPETYHYLQKENIKLGLLIDQLVRFKQLLKPEIAEKLGCERLDFDTPQLLTDDFNPIVEQARGLLALLVERGTGHLSQDQVEMLSDNFRVKPHKRHKSPTENLGTICKVKT